MHQVDHPEGHRWARTSLVGEAAIDHEREFGAVPVSGDVVRIRVAQRVEFDVLADPVSACPGPVRVGLGQLFEMTPAQTREIADRLNRAASFAEEVEGVMRLRLVAFGQG